MGTSLTRGGATHAFLWKDGVMRDIGGADASTYFITANAINWSDQAVGSGVDGFSIVAFSWAKGSRQILPLVVSRSDDEDARVVLHGWERHRPVAAATISAGSIIGTRKRS